MKINTQPPSKSLRAKRRIAQRAFLLAFALFSCAWLAFPSGARRAQDSGISDRAAPRIAGIVLDNERRPVGKVKIFLRGRPVGESGQDGSFSVAPAGRDARVALTFSAEGYVSNTRVYHPRAGGGNVVIIWPVAYRVRFDPARGLDVRLGSSGIKVPADALTGAAGERLDAPAELRFTLLDVTNQFQRAAAPGDFSGRMLDRGVRRLNSYGIFDLDIRDSGGRPLRLRREASIDLSIAVPPRLAVKPPRQVGFFDFDAAEGLWVQVGTFNFSPSTLTYNGSVTSFGGAHNLDDAQDTVCVTVKVVHYYNQSPMANFSVTAHGPQYDSYGVTDANGFVCLLVQKNATFTADAHGSLGSSYWLTPPFMVPTFTSPNFSSGASDCGNPTTCPYLGTVPVDVIVGL